MKNNTRKNKNKGYNNKYLSKKKTNKYVGGNNINDINNINNIDQINKQIEQENIDTQNKFLPSTNIMDSKLLDKASNLAENLGVKTIESIGNNLGLDLTNKEQVNQKLNQIKETISDPQNIQQLKEIISNAAQVGAVGIEAAKPFLDPLINTTIEKTKNAASKIGEAGVKIALNTATQIPGIGVVVGSVRSLSNAGEAGIAALNAGNEIIKTASNTLNATTKNFNRLMKEKGQLLERTQKSMNNFLNPINSMNQINPINPINPIKNNTIKNYNNYNQNKGLKGGKNKNKTRKFKNFKN